MEYSIVRYNKEISFLLPEKQEPFEIVGRLVLIYNGLQWETSESILEKPTYIVNQLENRLNDFQVG